MAKEPKSGVDRLCGSGSRGQRSGGPEGGVSPLLSPPRKRRGELPGGCGARGGGGGRGNAGDSCTTSGSGTAPRDPEAAEHRAGGAEPARRFPPPLRRQMCTLLPPHHGLQPPLAPCTPPPFLPAGSFPPGRAQHLLPVQSQFAGAPRTPRSPQRPRDTRPRHLWHPHPLMAFPVLAGRAGGGDRQLVCPNGARSPPRHRGAIAQRHARHPIAPAPRWEWWSGAEGAGPPHPVRHFPPNSSCPGSFWIQIAPGKGAARHPALANSWVRLKSKTGLAAGRENSLSSKIASWD